MLATQDVYALQAANFCEDDLRERLIRKRHVIDLMELSFAQEAAEFAATRDYEKDGSASPIDWIRVNCHMTGNAVADRVSVGALMGELEQTIGALVEGQVGFAHLTVMARTANGVGDRFNETALLEKARQCYRHHWMVHEGNWQIVRGDDGRMLTIPPTVTFGLPRGPD